MTGQALPLFIYGTLLAGECNRHLLAGSILLELPASTIGTLYVIEGDGYPYPALLSGTGVVHGSLITLLSKDYDERLACIDLLEDYDATRDTALYLRRTLETSTPHGPQPAWAYLWNGSEPTTAALADGNFSRWSQGQ